MNFTNVLLTELIFAAVVLLGLGFVKLPRFLRRKKLSRFFPWGYYPDQQPRADRYYPDDDKDFLHDTGTEFGGLDAFGDMGEFSGFGQLGEYGNAFMGGGDAGGGSM
ncbi:MAG: hypothetical protein K2X93_11795 [Candidatus Obscuribacterales bacterium]|nr:hypothetical protein [Candidatus Obscuribacterales bacterium]